MWDMQPSWQQHKEGLADKRGVPSLYVGESARSLCERAGEHWADAEGWKEESHMVEHQIQSHGGEENPAFNFRVVKQFGSSLERQVREAVRIQMRGTVLNKKGTFNRCKLTRLVVDTEWEDKVWKESWAPREQPPSKESEERGYEEWEGEESLAVVTKVKRPRAENGNSKRMKLAGEEGVAWGEEVPVGIVARDAFLYTEDQERRVDTASTQSKIKVYSGLEWMCRELLKETANLAATLAQQSEGVGK